MALLVLGGLGSYLVGEGLAGHEPGEAHTYPVEQSTVEAVKFDPYDRTFPQNEDLTMQSVTPALQRAALLMMPLGSIPAVAKSGLNIDRIKRAAPEDRLRVIESELRITWKTLLDAGILQLERVELHPSDPWNGTFYPYVRDLTTTLPSDKALKLVAKVT